MRRFCGLGSTQTLKFRRLGDSRSLVRGGIVWFPADLLRGGERRAVGWDLPLIRRPTILRGRRRNGEPYRGTQRLRLALS